MYHEWKSQTYPSNTNEIEKNIMKNERTKELESCGLISYHSSNSLQQFVSMMYTVFLKGGLEDLKGGLEDLKAVVFSL